MGNCSQLLYNYKKIAPILNTEANSRLRFKLTTLPFNRIDRIYRYKWAIHIKISSKLRVAAMTKWYDIPLIATINNLYMRSISGSIITPNPMASSS